MGYYHYHVQFSCMFDFIPHTCLVPEEARMDVRSPKTGVPAGCESPYGCFVLTHNLWKISWYFELSSGLSSIKIRPFLHVSCVWNIFIFFNLYLSPDILSSIHPFSLKGFPLSFLMDLLSFNSIYILACIRFTIFISDYIWFSNPELPSSFHPPLCSAFLGVTHAFILFKITFFKFMELFSHL